MNQIVDLHMHIVPGFDDGSRTTKESLEMLELSEKQGVSDVFCTSHNGYSKEDGEVYICKFNELKETVGKSKLNIRLHKGCEILCAGEYMEEIIYGLEIGAFTTLGESKYVLAELYPNARPSEALFIIDELKKNGYKPIIAHMERNYNITGIMVGTLIQNGALIQINAHSLVDEDDVEIRTRARDLLNREYVHFIGSDAHRSDHRPPNLTSGTNYILENTTREYAMNILYKNAQAILLNENIKMDIRMENKESLLEALYVAVSQLGLLKAVHTFLGSQAKIRLGFSKRVCDTPIDVISLSVRGYNSLKRNGVNTLGEAIDVINGDGLRCFRNLGQKTSAETKSKIINFGYNALNEKEKMEFLRDIIEINTGK